MSLAENPFGLFRQVLQSAARTICLPLADKFHTCSLRCVFVHVHAAAENDFHFIRRFHGELCEVFSRSERRRLPPLLFAAVRFYYSKSASLAWPASSRPVGVVPRCLP